MTYRFFKPLGLYVLALALMSAACKKKAECVKDHVAMGNWFNDETKKSAGKDALGGYIFLYWIDDKGHACHGEPGKDAAPGPIILRASGDSTFFAARTNDMIDDATLSRWQEIDIDRNNYRSTGLHFVQFDNVTWRTTRDRVVSKNKAEQFFSATQVADLSRPFCFSPVFKDIPGSYYGGFLVAPSDSLIAANKDCGCKVKKSPMSADMATEELEKISLVNLTHGLDASE